MFSMIFVELAMGEGWMYHLINCAFILLAGGIEWRLWCFATINLNNVSGKVTSVPMMFFIFGDLFQFTVQVYLSGRPLHFDFSCNFGLHFDFSCNFAASWVQLSELRVGDCDRRLAFSIFCYFFYGAYLTHILYADKHDKIVQYFTIALFYVCFVCSSYEMFICSLFQSSFLCIEEYDISLLTYELCLYSSV